MKRLNGMNQSGRKMRKMKYKMKIKMKMKKTKMCHLLLKKAKRIHSPYSQDKVKAVATPTLKSTMTSSEKEKTKP